MAKGVKIDLKLNRESIPEFNKAIEAAVRAAARKNPCKVDLKVDTSQGQAMSLNRQISKVIEKAGKNQPIQIKKVFVDQIDFRRAADKATDALQSQLNSHPLNVSVQKIDASKAVQSLRNDIIKMLKGIHIDGVGEFIGSFSNLDGVEEAINKVERYERAQADAMRRTQQTENAIKNMAQAHKRLDDIEKSARKLGDGADMRDTLSQVRDLREELANASGNVGDDLVREVSVACSKVDILLSSVKNKLEKEMSQTSTKDILKNRERELEKMRTQVDKTLNKATKDGDVQLAQSAQAYVDIISNGMMALGNADLFEYITQEFRKFQIELAEAAQREKDVDALAKSIKKLKDASIGMPDSWSEIGNADVVAKLTAEHEKLAEAINQIETAGDKQGAFDKAKKSADDLRGMVAEAKRLDGVLNKLDKAPNSLWDQMAKVSKSGHFDELKAEVEDFIQSINSLGMDKPISELLKGSVSLEKVFTDLKSKISDFGAIDAVGEVARKANEKIGDLDQSKQAVALLAQEYKNLARQIDNAYSEKDESKRAEAIALAKREAKRIDDLATKYQKIAKLQQQINQLKTANPSLYNMYAKTLDDAFASLGNFDIPDQDFDKIREKLQGIFDLSDKGGDNTKGFWETLNNSFDQFSAFSLIDRAVDAACDKVLEMFDAVLKLDAAMTELKKVTDLTEVEYNNFYRTASKLSGQVGATISDTINATADFARFGFDLGEATELAEAAIIYKNVGDGIENISQASESMISTIKAFGLEASDAAHIVDAFNEVGNNFAISSTGIGDALQRSAASLSAAGNTLEESIGLITGMNSVLQNPESVGTTLKTLTMYLRAAKTEAEESGIATDGMADSVSQLRDSLLSLTGGRVDIMIDENTFKSTYDIIKDLAAVWNELSDVTRSNILNQIGGKRNANAITALITNFKDAQEAADAATNSFGSATKENEKYLDSLNGKLTELKASFEALSGSILNSDLLKLGMDGANLGLDFLTWLSDIGALLPILTSLINIIQVGAKLNKNKSSYGEAIKNLKSGTNILTPFVALWDRLKSIVSVVINSIKNLPKILTVATQHMSTFGAILTAISVAMLAYKGINWLFGSSKDADNVEKARELTEKYKEQQQQTESEIEAIKSLREEYARLSEGVDENGKNISLTATEYDRYLEIVDQVASMSDGLVTGIDNETTSYQNLKTAVDDVLKSKQDLAKEQADAYFSNTDIIKGAQSAYNTAWDNLRKDNNKKELKRLKELVHYTKEGAMDNIISSLGLDSYNDLFSADGIETILNNRTKFEELMREGSDLNMNGVIDGYENDLTELDNILDILSVSAKTLTEARQGFGEIMLEHIRYAYDEGENAIDLSGLSKEMQAELINEMALSFDPDIDWKANSDKAVEIARDFVALFDNQEIQNILAQAEWLKIDGSDEAVAEYNKRIEQVFEELANNPELDFDKDALEAAKKFLLRQSDFAAQAMDSSARVRKASLHTSNTLADSASHLQKGYKAYQEAMEDMADDGSLSIDAISNLQSALGEGDDIANYLIVEDGLIKLNTEAWLERSRAMMSGYITEAESNLDTLEKEKTILEALAKVGDNLYNGTERNMSAAIELLNFINKNGNLTNLLTGNFGDAAVSGLGHWYAKTGGKMGAPIKEMFVGAIEGAQAAFDENLALNIMTVDSYGNEIDTGAYITKLTEKARDEMLKAAAEGRSLSPIEAILKADSDGITIDGKLIQNAVVNVMDVYGDAIDEAENAGRLTSILNTLFTAALTNTPIDMTWVSEQLKQVGLDAEEAAQVVEMAQAVFNQDLDDPLNMEKYASHFKEIGSEAKELYSALHSIDTGEILGDQEFMQMLMEYPEAMEIAGRYATEGLDPLANKRDILQETVGLLEKEYQQSIKNAKVDILQKRSKELQEAMPEIAKQMQEFQEGSNVDLLVRPVIDTSALSDWGEEAGNSATIYTVSYGIGDQDKHGDELVNFDYEKDAVVTVTPILPDGSVMTPGDLWDYLADLASRGAEGDILELDRVDRGGLGLIVGVDDLAPDETFDQAYERTSAWYNRLHELQAEFYLNEDYPDTYTNFFSWLDMVAQAGTMGAFGNIEDSAKSTSEAIANAQETITEAYEAMQSLKGVMSPEEFLPLLSEFNIPTDAFTFDGVDYIISDMEAVQNAINSAIQTAQAVPGNQAATEWLNLYSMAVAKASHATKEFESAQEDLSSIFSLYEKIQSEFSEQGFLSADTLASVKSIFGADMSDSALAYIASNQEELNRILLNKADELTNSLPAAYAEAWRRTKEQTLKGISEYQKLTSVVDKVNGFESMMESIKEADQPFEAIIAAMEYIGEANWDADQFMLDGELNVEALIDYAEAAIEASDVSDSLKESMLDAIHVAAGLSSTFKSAAESIEKTASSMNTAFESLSNVGAHHALTFDVFKQLMEISPDYMDALEYQNGMLTLSTEKYIEITDRMAESAIAKAEEQAMTIELSDEYQYLTDRADELRAVGEELSAVDKERLNDLEMQINGFRTLADQIRNAASALSHFGNMDISATDDMFSTAKEALELITNVESNKDSEFYGQFGNEGYQAATKALIPFERGTKEYNASLKRLKSYFSTDHPLQGINNFATDLEKTAKSLGLYNEATGEITGDTMTYARALGITEEALRSLLKQTNLYIAGAEAKFDLKEVDAEVARTLMGDETTRESAIEYSLHPKFTGTDKPEKIEGYEEATERIEKYLGGETIEDGVMAFKADLDAEGFLDASGNLTESVDVVADRLGISRDLVLDLIELWNGAEWKPKEAPKITADGVTGKTSALFEKGSSLTEQMDAVEYAMGDEFIKRAEANGATWAQIYQDAAETIGEYVGGTPVQNAEKLHEKLQGVSGALTEDGQLGRPLSEIAKELGVSSQFLHDQILSANELGEGFKIEIPEGMGIDESLTETIDPLTQAIMENLNQIAGFDFSTSTLSASLIQMITNFEYEFTQAISHLKSLTFDESALAISVANMVARLAEIRGIIDQLTGGGEYGGTYPPTGSTPPQPVQPEATTTLETEEPEEVVIETDGVDEAIDKAEEYKDAYKDASEEVADAVSDKPQEAVEDLIDTTEDLNKTDTDKLTDSIEETGEAAEDSGKETGNLEKTIKEIDGLEPEVEMPEETKVDTENLEGIGDAAEQAANLNTELNNAKAAEEGLSPLQIDNSPALAAIDALIIKLDDLIAKINIVNSMSLRLKSGKSGASGNSESGTKDGSGGALGNSSYGVAYARGTTHALHGRTLVGELGMETVVDPHNYRYYTVGNHGAEFVNLPKDAIVFNAEQTDQLFSRGNTPTRGTAMASGTLRDYSMGGILSGISKYQGSSSSGSSSSKNKTARKSSSKKEKSPFEDLLEEYEELIAVTEHLIEHQEHLYEVSERALDYDGMATSLSEQAKLYKEIMADAMEGVNAMKAKGAKDTDEELQKLEKAYWDAYSDLYDIYDDLNELYTDALKDKIDALTDGYESLIDAADEISSSGALSIDTFTDILDNGLQYLSLLDKVGDTYVLNQEKLQDMMAAEKEQLAIQSALSYLNQLQIAAADKSAGAIANLIDASNQVGDSTWDIVYAQAASLKALGLTEDQYNAIIINIDKMRDLADQAAMDMADATSDLYEKQREAIDYIYEKTKELIEFETEEKIEALEDQIDAFNEIIDKKRESLELTKDEDDYTKSVAEKTQEIAKLQAKIDQLSLDDSRAAQAERAKLLEELESLQKDLAEEQADHSYDLQMDALDKEAEAFEKQKEAEIETLEESISSEEKLHQAAIERLKNGWDTLYQELIAWNFEAGSVLNEEITENWEIALEAAKKYGSYVQALEAFKDGNTVDVTIGTGAEDLPHYHSGGVVDDRGAINSSEVLAVLKKDELVLDRDGQKSVYQIVDYAQVLGKKLGVAIKEFTAPVINAARTATKVDAGKAVATTAKTSGDTFSPTFHVSIEHNGAITDDDAQKYGEKIATTAMDKLYNAFKSRGITEVSTRLRTV